MSQAVEEIILRPMQRLYPPPQHLRTDAEARELALEHYRRALTGFDRDTLARGWERLVATHDYWCWPNPAAVVEACRACAPAKSEEARRQEQAREMAEGYAGRYMRTSQLAQLAKREGWASRLREYVEAAAWVQAQLICGCRGIGWSAYLLASRDHRSSQEAFAAYRATIAGPVAKGQVRVTVPPARVRGWKECCRGRALGE